MQYYKFGTVSDPKMKGVRDGWAQVELDENKVIDKEGQKKSMEFLSWINIYKHSSFLPGFNISIEGFTLRRKANVTDFIDFSPALAFCSFLVSEKAKQFLERFTLADCFFYPVKIWNGGIALNDRFYLLYMPPLNMSTIDFANSILFIGNELVGERAYFEVSSYEEYINKEASASKHFETMQLSDKFNDTFDVFKLYMTGGISVSEKFKTAFSSSGLTGAKIYNPEILPKVVR